MTQQSSREQRRDAYNLGYDRFHGAGRPVVLEDYIDFGAYRQTATWANQVLPKLRELAGAEDVHGAGTYTDMTDEQAHHLEDLIDAFEEGATDGLLDRERDP